MNTMWEADFATGLVWCSPGLAALWGLAPGSELTVAELQQRYVWANDAIAVAEDHLVERPSGMWLVSVVPVREQGRTIRLVGSEVAAPPAGTQQPTPPFMAAPAGPDARQVADRASFSDLSAGAQLLQDAGFAMGAPTFGEGAAYAFVRSQQFGVAVFHQERVAWANAGFAGLFESTPEAVFGKLFGELAGQRGQRVFSKQQREAFSQVPPADFPVRFDAVVELNGQPRIVHWVFSVGTLDRFGPVVFCYALDVTPSAGYPTGEAQRTSVLLAAQRRDVADKLNSDIMGALIAARGGLQASGMTSSALNEALTAAQALLDDLIDGTGPTSLPPTGSQPEKQASVVQPTFSDQPVAVRDTTVALLSMSLDAVIVFDTAGTPVWASPASVAVFGFDVTNAASDLQDRVLPEGALSNLDAVEARTVRYLHPDTGWRFLQALEGQTAPNLPVHRVVVVRDVTANLKQTERLERLMEASPTAIIALRENGVSFVSRNLTRAFGVEPGGEPTRWQERVVAEDQPMFKEFFHAVLHGDFPEEPLRFGFKVGTGSLRWVEAQAADMRADEFIQAVVVSFRDVSDKVLADRRTDFFMEHVNDAVMVLSPAGEVLWSNQVAHEQFNGIVGTFTEQHISALMDDTSALEEAFVAVRDGHREQACVLAHPHDSHGNQRSFLVRFVDGRHSPFVNGIVSFASDVADLGEAMFHIAHLNEELRSAVKALANARISERVLVAREIHDDPLQRLTVLQWAIAALDQSGELAKEAADVESSLRSIISGLHLPVLQEQPLSSLLGDLADSMRTHVELDIAAGCDAVPSDKAQMVWRTAREILRNVDQHAEASVVKVQVWLDEAGLLALRIADDGVGVEPLRLAAAVREGHIGLLSARESVLSAGGSFELESLVAKGTTVVVRLPFDSGLASI